MKIAIVSDSHGSIDRLEILFQRLETNNIQQVLHCGDFLVDGVVDIFKKHPKIQFYIAQGNCDVNTDLLIELKKLKNIKISEIIYFELNNLSFASSHIEGIAQNQLKNKKVDIFCHGHTHRKKIEKRNGKIILNPGALCEDGEYFLLDTISMKLNNYKYTK